MLGNWCTMTTETTVWWQGWASSFPGLLNPRGSRWSDSTVDQLPKETSISVSRSWDWKISREKSKEISLERHEAWEYYGNPEGHSLRVAGQEGRTNPSSCKTRPVREKASQMGGEERERGVKGRAGNLVREPRNNLGWETPPETTQSNLK